MTDRHRVLVATPFPPTREAPHGGGRIVAEMLLRLAARHDVALLTLAGAGDPGVDAALVERLDRVDVIERRPIGRSLRRLVSEPGRVAAMIRRDPPWVVGCEVSAARRMLPVVVRDWRPEVIQLEFLAMARYASALDVLHPPVVLVHHDAAPDGKDRAAGAWTRHARRSVDRVEALVVFSDEDRVRSAGLGVERIRVIRPGLELPPVASAPHEGIVFVGAFSHGPNLEAADRLVDAILPLVRARLPEVELTLVGDNLPGELANAPGVVSTGRVPDAGPYVDRAAVVVAPLDRGSGVRIKVLDALARGKALVATSRAVEGLGLVEGEHAWIRDDDKAFADAVVALLRDDRARERLGATARAWAEASLGWDSVVDRYDALYDEVLRQ